MKIGYVRVSTKDQNTARQEIVMEELGVEKVFIDKCSGKNAQRPGLKEMMNFVREGDTVIVSEISRFARNTRDLLDLVEQLNNKNVQFESLKEKIDTNTPTGKFMLTVFAAVSQLERDYIKERQREGFDAAKKRGVKMGAQYINISDSDFKREYDLWKEGHITAVEAMKHLNIKPNTFYRRVKLYEESGSVKECKHA